MAEEKTTSVSIVNIPKGDEAYAVAEVLRLIQEGYTSGIDPTWDITDED